MCASRTSNSVCFMLIFSRAGLSSFQRPTKLCSARGWGVANSCACPTRQSLRYRNSLGWWKVFYSSTPLFSPTKAHNRLHCFRHHAQKSHASGFCYVADCILAILSLKRVTLATVPQSQDRTTSNARKPRVMYLDLDLHFSDAVSEAFTTLNSPSVPQVLVSQF